MPQTNFIVREPLLDPKQRVIGYELSLLSTEALHAMPPERMVLTMTAADMADPDTLSAVQ